MGKAISVGERRINARGYYEVKLSPGDFFYPMADVRHYVLEHRLIMAKHLGRILWKTEIVDHINHDRTDNRLANLRLYESRNAHDSNHAKNRDYIRNNTGQFITSIYRA